MTQPAPTPIDAALAPHSLCVLSFGDRVELLGGTTALNQTVESALRVRSEPSNDFVRHSDAEIRRHDDCDVVTTEHDHAKSIFVRKL